MSKVKSPWDTFSFSQPNQQQQPAAQGFNRGSFVPKQNNTFQGNRTTNPASRWVQQQPTTNTKQNSRWAQQAQQPWQQQNQIQMHPQLYHQPGDLLPSYYEPEIFIDHSGNPTTVPSTEQWLHRHAVRSAQVGVGTALIHFGEGLVQAYLPWKNK